MELRDPAFEGPLKASVTALHGFLTCVVSGPLVLPSRWIPAVFRNGESEGWETIRQAKRAMTLLMRFYNEVVTDLTEQYGAFSIMLVRIGTAPDVVDLADDWCSGYLAGIALREEEWQQALAARELDQAFASIISLAHPELGNGPDPFSEPDDYSVAMQALPQAAIDIYDWWRTPRSVRRATPKISANAACPCGSGKKYKRCCSPLRAV